ncbi:phenazine-specific anthranilate synthase component I [Actinokineospora enzanensis]|uniref:phenazine-specific anthranilate synthase component I n=1 Tax=Actinokineospora enzanensis TaxID=155975 RepID=UPI00036E5F32|nr:phenazine-specific anthranilate synthase component I [Actinokineospora enzanensis]
MTRVDGHELLAAVLGADPPPFALIHRSGGIDVVVGETSTPESLSDIPVPDRPTPGHHTLVVVPFRQLAERGFACVDDGAPLIAMAVTGQAVLPVDEVLGRLPDGPVDLRDGRFDLADDEYADLVRRVVADEIGAGNGANFVLKRTFEASIPDYTPADALSVFRRLVLGESGSHWTFVVHTGTHTFVGASPERHVSLDAGVAVMNPISGTYRFPAGGPTLDGVLEFLRDGKETDELYMVLDEELKMMAGICPDGGRVVGPRLREMARLAHTEYFIEGGTNRDPRDILRDTLFAPTVTGSPIESACRVIRDHEPDGRGYYSGVIALLGHDDRGRDRMDSAILIRTAEISPAGRLSIGVGATLVRHSDPATEAAETVAKLSGLRAAFAGVRMADRPEVRTALSERNTHLARFWLSDAPTTSATSAGRTVLVVDAEDTFTAMLARQLRSLGCVVTVRPAVDPGVFADYDLVLFGPGPGDPLDRSEPRILALRNGVRTMLDAGRPFIAVCLSHQILASELGFRVERREEPNQGLQKEITLFERGARVGFYNTFAVRSTEDRVDCVPFGKVEVSRDVSTGEVHALRGRGFASVQFHPESVLTVDGPGLLSDLISHSVSVAALAR